MSVEIYHHAILSSMSGAGLTRTRGLTNDGQRNRRWLELLRGDVLAAVEHFAPDDAAAMVHTVEVDKEADKIEAGMRKLKIAAYDTVQSNKARETFVNAAAPAAE
ncbi:hypothetical protein [Paenirhodobacter sp.]|uniref:hypothetical protein n=1 Tax=Paenirhodobacter sp. TaxID=1965326 RepID=UPI003B3EB4F5